MRLEDVNGGHVVDGAPVDAHQDTVVAIQPADHRQHLFGQFLALDIGLEKLIFLFVVHVVTASLDIEPKH